jgi:hypothetical protein
LLDLLPPDAPRNNWRRTLLRVLARMLYPSTLDLHGFRVVAGYGRQPVGENVASPAPWARDADRFPQFTQR